MYRSAYRFVARWKKSRTTFGEDVAQRCSTPRGFSRGSPPTMKVRRRGGRSPRFIKQKHSNRCAHRSDCRRRPAGLFLSLCCIAPASIASARIDEPRLRLEPVFAPGGWSSTVD